MEYLGEGKAGAKEAMIYGRESDNHVFFFKGSIFIDRTEESGGALSDGLE